MHVGVGQDFPAHYKQIFKDAARPQAAKTEDARRVGIQPTGHELASSVGELVICTNDKASRAS